ncbi:Scr1 family TA system antitoxin-like transcriptional regulator [Nocardia sp. NPDC046763]|uniref:Scr1 family TA system antitoxin-like transcriptional regulator n=1 Tax=Nocardia sp. NPDC046763 TaxID=3155256 RepID=UPI0033DD65CC
MTLPPVVYAEGAIGSVLHEHDEEVDEYREAIAGLRAVALTAQGTRDLLVRIAKEHTA